MQQSLIFTINLDSLVNPNVQNYFYTFQFPKLQSTISNFFRKVTIKNSLQSNTLETNLHFSLSENQDKVTLAPTSNTVLFASASDQSKIEAFSKPITFENNWPWQYELNVYKSHFLAFSYYSGQSPLSYKEFTISPAYKDFL